MKKLSCVGLLALVSCASNDLPPPAPATPPPICEDRGILLRWYGEALDRSDDYENLLLWIAEQPDPGPSWGAVRLKARAAIIRHNGRGTP